MVYFYCYFLGTSPCFKQCFVEQTHRFGQACQDYMCIKLPCPFAERGCCLQNEDALQPNPPVLQGDVQTTSRNRSEAKERRVAVVAAREGLAPGQHRPVGGQRSSTNPCLGACFQCGHSNFGTWLTTGSLLCWVTLIKMKLNDLLHGCEALNLDDRIDVMERTCLPGFPICTPQNGGSMIYIIQKTGG